ncbi:MAG: type II secretion system secretin GspD [Gammaproteobacteria bacterium]|nr:type II secretion system secretin GspD [Gammaproteobacteria bacterium]
MTALKPNLRRYAATLLLLTFSLLPGALVAEGEMITPNYKDADIRTIIEAVSEVTGINFIIDARVKAQVTLISSSPMSADAFYETFLSILQVYGFVAIPSGDVVKIVPDTNARQLPGNDLPRSIADTDEIVTQVIQVQNVGAAQLVPILRPLVPQYGHLAAHPASNMLIIADRAANVNRMLRIIRRIDQAGDEDIEVVRLEHASAGDLVRILTSLSQAAARSEGGGSPLQMVADDRTNTILVSGDKAERLRFRALIAHLDTPHEDGGNTQVIYLEYADAEELAAKLKEQTSQTNTPGSAQSAGAGNNVVIWADAATNALVVTAPTKVMRSLRSVIDRLDIRRAQVRVEAIVVDLTSDRSAELGITWAIDSTKDTASAALTNFSGTTNVADVAGAILSGGDVATAAQGLGDGLTYGVGSISKTGTSFAAVVTALASDANTNILSVPSIVTMDNEEAEVNVGQEVPFLTGSFSNTGGVVGQVNPFQTIQRQDVGLTLKVTPQVNEGDAIIMDIDLEVSSLGQGTQGAVDLVTNQRNIRQKVIVEDGGIIVLGGLMDESLLEGNQRVPGLSRIPILGNLFKSRSTKKVKRNLMVFISPRILRDRTDTFMETNQKYQYIRELQLGTGGDVALMPNEEPPVIPPLEEFAPDAMPETDEALIIIDEP